jgi:hypothetical protein
MNFKEKVNWRKFEEDIKYLRSFSEELREKMENEVDKKIKFIDEETDKIILHAIRKIDSSVMTREDCIEFLKVYKDKFNMQIIKVNQETTGNLLLFDNEPIAGFYVNEYRGTIQEQDIHFCMSEEKRRRMLYPHRRKF